MSVVPWSYERIYIPLLVGMAAICGCAAAVGGLTRGNARPRPALLIGTGYLAKIATLVILVINGAGPHLPFDALYVAGLETLLLPASLVLAAGVQRFGGRIRQPRWLARFRSHQP